ncbi:MAG: Alpha/beta hydrolase [Pedosphaera sp.]|nr:Alpha/beta hydrolase [Pedosphaera sp.]
MKILMSLLSLFLFSSQVKAQPKDAMPLWPDGAPGALGKAEKDVPTLAPFFPDAEKATGAAMVICPGGGYSMLAEHEGKGYALWLKDQGIAAFVLKYRLGSAGYRHPVMLQDAARAMRLVRANAKEWKIDTNRIGIIGSSAGGHLASTLLTHFDAGKPDDADPVERQSSRPDVGVLCYPVITMRGKTHGGSRDNLLGKDPSPELMDLLSNELQVTKDTPPCFIFHTDEDKTVPVENSLQFAAALRQAGVPFDLHIYKRGPHGIGLGASKTYPTKFHPWVGDCEYWLKEQGFLK